MHKVLKTGAALLFAGMALLGAGVMDARAEVVEEHMDDASNYYRLCHTNGWYYNELAGFYGSSKRDGIKIFGYDGADEDLAVPETLDGFEVVAVGNQDPQMGNYSMEISRKVKSFKIPGSIREFNPVSENSDDWDEEKYFDYYHGRPIIQLSGLERYEVSADNSVYKSEDGILFSKDGKHLVHYPPSKKGTRYDIPDGVEYVCMDAFCDNKYLKTLVLPDSVKVIGSSAFGGSNLKKIYIPASVKSLNTSFEKAVAYCQKSSSAEKYLKDHKEKFKSYVKPSEPGKVTVKTPKSRKASLSWKSVSGATGYEVYKSESRYGDCWEKVKAEAKGKKGRQICNIALKEEISAWYRIRAYKKAGPGKIYGNYSEPALVLAKPGAVKDLGVSRNSSKYASIVWRRIAATYDEGCSGYQVYRRELPSKKYRKAATVKTGYATYFLDKGLKPGKTYYYKIRAYNSAEGKKTYGPFSKPVKASGK